MVVLTEPRVAMQFCVKRRPRDEPNAFNDCFVLPSIVALDLEVLGQPSVRALA